MINSKHLSLSVLGALLSYCAYSMDRVTTISAGPAWYEAGHTQNIELQSDVVNTYLPSQTTHPLTSGELFTGFQKSIGSTLIGQFGLALGASTNTTIKGDIWELSDPVFDNFVYQYELRHTQVTVKGILLSKAWSEQWLPYLSAGVGVGFNKVYDYNTHSKIFAAVPPPPFQANTQTTFSYTLGVGLQAVFSSHWQAGMGYLFSDWGASQLSPSWGQTSASGIQMNHFYTNQLQMSLSYIV